MGGKSRSAVSLFENSEELESAHPEFIRLCRPINCHHREILNELWRQFEPHCADNDFAEEFQRAPVGRYWEMALANVFVRNGFPLKRPPRESSPDLLLVTSCGKLWIEAVAPKPGEGDNDATPKQVPDPAIENCYALYPQTTKTLLRYTQALNEKIKQLARRLEAGVVDSSDCYVIAICAGQLFDSGNDPDPASELIIQALFEIGEMRWSVPIGGNKEVEVIHPHEANVKKHNDSTIPKKTFQEAQISAVLFYPHGLDPIFDTPEDYFFVIHNPNASVPLPRSTIPCKREYYVEEGYLKWATE